MQKFYLEKLFIAIYVLFYIDDSKKYYTEKLFISIFTIVFFNLGKNVSLRIFVSKNTKLYNNDIKL